MQEAYGPASCPLLLAKADQEYDLGAKLGMGFPIAQGCYYGMDLGNTPLTADELLRLERHGSLGAQQVRGGGPLDTPTPISRSCPHVEQMAR